MSQVLPRGDRWAMAGLVLGCVLFGLGSLIIVFVGVLDKKGAKNRCKPYAARL